MPQPASWTSQVTAVSVVPVTVAAKVVWPEAARVIVDGLTATATGGGAAWTVTTAVALLVGSAWLVTTTWQVVAVAGAV